MSYEPTMDAHPSHADNPLEMLLRIKRKFLPAAFTALMAEAEEQTLGFYCIPQTGCSSSKRITL